MHFHLQKICGIVLTTLLFCTFSASQWQGGYQTPRVTPRPDNYPTPEVTPTPDNYPTPEVTPTPDNYPTPEVTPTPDNYPTPEVTPTPDNYPTPEVTPTQDNYPTPEVTPTPDNYPTPMWTPRFDNYPGPIATQMPNIYRNLSREAYFQRALEILRAVIQEEELRQIWQYGINVLCAVPFDVISCRDRTGFNAGLVGPLQFQCFGKADVLFVVDSSESIGRGYFHQALTFLANLVGSFRIGPNHFRFGEVIFSDVGSTVFSLSQYSTHLDILSAILSTPFIGKSTHTDDGLKTASELLLSSLRPRVPGVVIVITDGFSADFLNTQLQAIWLESYGIQIMAIGVGDEIREKELYNIASNPSLVYTLKDSSSVNIDLSNIAHKVCEVTGGKETVIPVIPPTTKGYVYTTPEEEPITYTRVPTTESTTTEPTTTTPPTTTEPTTPTTTTTTTTEPTTTTTTTVPTTTTTTTTTTPAPTTTTTTPTTTTTTTTTTTASTTTTKTTAPTTTPTTTTTKPTTLTTTAATTKTTATTTTERAKACKAFADILFVLDSSGSIGDKNYQTMLRFAANITDRFNVSKSDVLFAQIIFGKYVEKKFEFKDYLRSAALKRAILSTNYLKQETRTDRALDYVVNSTMFSEKSGARPGAKRIVLLMTDGASDNPVLTLQAARRVKERGITIIAIGIANANEKELRQVASSADDVVRAISFNDLQSIVDKVTTRACIWV